MLLLLLLLLGQQSLMGGIALSIPLPLSVPCGEKAEGGCVSGRGERRGAHREVRVVGEVGVVPVAAAVGGEGVRRPQPLPWPRVAVGVVGVAVAAGRVKGVSTRVSLPLSLT